MNSPPEKKRLYHLFGAQAHGTITAAEHEELQDCLRDHPDARQLWFLHQDLDDGLIELANDNSPTFSIPRITTPSPWFKWRPLTAAAAGLAIGLFSASVVIAIATPRTVKHQLALTNPSFEEASGSLPGAKPLRFSTWTGQGEFSTAQSGFTPVAGRQMLRFKLPPHTPAPWGAATSVAKISQVVNLREWREALRDGRATVDWSVYFNGSPETPSTKTTYRVDVRAYSGALSVLEQRWEARQNYEVAHCVSKVAANRSPADWQSVSGSLILPPDTDFLLIELKLFQADRGDAPHPRTESQHFVDDLNLSLTTPSFFKPAPLPPSDLHEN